MLDIFFLHLNNDSFPNIPDSISDLIKNDAKEILGEKNET